MFDIKSRKLNINPSIAQITGVSAGAALATIVMFESQPSYAVGEVPQDVQTAVDNTVATVQALSPIALAAVAAALVPFGASMALSFVRKVMSNA